MLFSSLFFLSVFLPAVLAAYYLTPRRARNVVLLVASVLFYAWGDFRYLGIMFGVITLNFVGALVVQAVPDSARVWRRTLVALFVVGTLSVLFYYKYFDFFMINVSRLTNFDYSLRHIIMPLGISFYTFDFLQLVIIDDGSGPEYQGIFDGLAVLPGVTVLHLGVNSGMGGAIKWGLQYALYKYPEAKGFVAFDADGQHLPEDVRKVVDEFLKSPECLAVGVRNFHDPSLHIPFRSRFGNRITEVVFRLFTGIRLSDTQTGLRCYPRSLAAKITQIRCSRYEFQLEALLVAAADYEYLQIPIQTIYEDGNRRSHFNPVLDSLRIYSIFLKFIGATAICSGIDYVVFALLYLMSSTLFASMVIARVVSVSVNFILNRKRVFRSHGKIMGEIVGFASLAIFLFASSYYGVSLLKTRLGVNPLISKIAVEMSLFLVSYLVQHHLIFRKKRG